MLHRVAWQKFTDISEVLTTYPAASTSEMSVNFCQSTGRNIPEDSHLFGLHLFV
jgi:hypothetical protein